MQTNKDESGFTMIETLIALMIISIALLISAQTISIATRSEVMASEKRGLIAAHRAILSSEYQNFQCYDRVKRGVYKQYRWTMHSTGGSESFDGSQSSCFVVIEIKTTMGTQKFLHFRSGVAE